MTLDTQDPPPVVPERIVAGLRAAAVSVVASLPDSWLTTTIEAVDAAADLVHVPVAREDDGAGVCAGATLAGARAALLCQNGGLLLAGNALAGFAHHHELGFLVLAADRGGPGDRFAYQAYKGRVTRPVLDAVGLPVHHIRAPSDLDVLPGAMIQALAHRRPVVLLMGPAVLTGDGTARS